MRGLRAVRNPTHFTLSMLLCVVLTTAQVFAQTTKPEPQSGGTASSSTTAGGSGNVSDHSSETKETDAAPALSPEELRQAQLAADTKKLYQLAAELRAEVAKTSKDTLSLSVVKKADEVEKLAKSIKDRMKSQASLSK